MSRDVWRRSVRRGNPPFLSITPTPTMPSEGSFRTLCRIPHGEDHHRLRVRGGPGPGKTAAHGRGRIEPERSGHRHLRQPADGGPARDHPGDRKGHPDEAVRGRRRFGSGRPGERGYLVVPDRKEAIATAIAWPEASDIVLIAGKGHEDYQIIGTRKFPFDDRSDRPGRAGTVANREGRIMTDDTPALSAGEILKATGGTPLRGGTDWTCRGISTDTRTLRGGEPLHRPSGGKLRRPRLPRRRPPKRAPRGSSSGRRPSGKQPPCKRICRSSASRTPWRRWGQSPTPGVCASRSRSSPITGSSGKTTTKETPRGHRRPIANGPEVNGKLQQPDRPSPDPSGDQGGARTRHRRAGDEPPRRDRAACRHRRTRRRADHEHRPRPYRRARLAGGDPRGEGGSLPGHGGTGNGGHQSR